MTRRTKIAMAVASATLAFAGAAGAAGTGVLMVSIGSGPHETASGIQVHGKWLLVVRGRNHRVVARRRFENSLTSTGAKVLVSYLEPAVSNGQVVAGMVGGQEVVLDDGSTPGHGCNLLVTQNVCALSHAETRGSSGGQPGSGSLHVAVNGSTVTWSGNVTPLVAVTIKKVKTMLKTCDTWLGYDSEDCANKEPTNGEAAWYDFTSKTLSPNLTVQAGQSVSVSVQISFS